MMAERPVVMMLKDYLELDCESSSDGFRCYPRRLGDPAPMRQLLDAEFRFGGRSPMRTRSANALTKLSAALNLKRSLSKRLKGSFWKRREEHDLENDATPSPVVSSCGSSDADSDSDSDLSGESGSDFAVHSSAPSSECLADIVASAAKDSDHETQTVHESESMECHHLEVHDKEQLSPVSVMDFPYEDDEDEHSKQATVYSPSFQKSLAQLERTKIQLMHKIRRFESLAELGPVDLEGRFAASESEVDDDQPLEPITNAGANPGECENYEEEEEQEQECGTEETRAWAMLGLLKGTTASVGPDAVFEKLLLDFFVEELSCSRSDNRTWSKKYRISRTSGIQGEERRLMQVAQDWIDGIGWCWDLREGRGEVEIAEVERNGRWRCLDEEEREIGAAVEGSVLESLVDELVRELAV